MLIVRWPSGECEEDVIEVRRADGKRSHVDRLVGKPVEHGPQRLHASVAWNLQRELVAVVAGQAEHSRCRAELIDVGEFQPQVTARDEPLELARRALGDQLAVVEHGDPVGELIGLLHVLRRKEDRDAVGHEVTDDLPELAAAARVKAGCRLVKEDDPGPADQRHREVKPAPHSA